MIANAFSLDPRGIRTVRIQAKPAYWIGSPAPQAHSGCLQSGSIHGAENFARVVRSSSRAGSRPPVPAIAMFDEAFRAECIPA